jgi:hypothetical protein
MVEFQIYVIYDIINLFHQEHEPVKGDALASKHLIL